MHKYKSEFLSILSERGFIHQISDADSLDELFRTETVAAYIGFDPTAKSLHVGSLLQIMMLYWLQQTGHKPVILVGGGTGLIGDPSFKDEARKLLSADQIEENINSLKDVFANYVSFSGENSGVLVNNAQWLTSLKYIEFLRDIGQYFSVNRMLSFDSVKLRLDREQSLSFLEFNYMILQAYDFVELYRTHGVRLQLGGSDQWGNIVNGLDLAHKLRLPKLYGLTSPLITTASGAKMGKSVNGAIWLNKSMLDPYNFWQYWRNSEDADVGRFFKIYTNLPLDEIERFGKLKGQEINEAKKILATTVTSMLHGEEAAKQAQKAAEQLFETNKLSDDIPTHVAGSNEVGLLKLLVDIGFCSSNSDARRSIKAGAIKINDKQISDEALIISKEMANCDGKLKLGFGKKKHVLVVF